VGRDAKKAAIELIAGMDGIEGYHLVISTPL
jgi:hypothetical protein